MNTAEYETMFRVEEKHWWYRALHRLLFQALQRAMPDWRERRVLDAGCGTGAVLSRLGNPATNLGIDVSDEALRFCRQRGLNNVMKGDVMSPPFADESFDAIICSSVLYHEWVPDVGRALAGLYRVLRPGGVLLLILPAFRFLHSAHDDAVMTARRFTRRETRSLLLAAGYEVERLTYWTSLLFPFAVAARTLRGSREGRDFNSGALANAAFGSVMTVERVLLRIVSMPAGVALLAVARKPVTAPGGR